MNDEKPHRRTHPSHGVVFWAGNTAGNEDDATHAIVYCGPPGMPYPEFEFRWPEQQRDVEKLETALAKAFKRGQEHAKQEIRSVLGCKS